MRSAAGTAHPSQGTSLGSGEPQTTAGGGKAKAFCPLTKRQETHILFQLELPHNSNNSAKGTCLACTIRLRQAVTNREQGPALSGAGSPGAAPSDREPWGAPVLGAMGTGKAGRRGDGAGLLGRAMLTPGWRSTFAFPCINASIQLEDVDVFLMRLRL